MTSKERVLTAAAPGRPDRVPMDFNANPATMKRLMADFGASSLRELLIKLHVDIVDIRGVVDPVGWRPAGELLGHAAQGHADCNRPRGLLR